MSEVPELPHGVVHIEDDTLEALNEVTEAATTLEALDDHAVNRLMKSAAKVKRAIEADRKTCAKPYQDAVKTVQSVFKPALARVDAAIAACKKRLATIVREQAEEERKRLEAEKDAHTDGRPTPPLIPPKLSADPAPAVSHRTTLAAGPAAHMTTKAIVSALCDNGFKSCVSIDFAALAALANGDSGTRKKLEACGIQFTEDVSIIAR